MNTYLLFAYASASTLAFTEALLLMMLIGKTNSKPTAYIDINLEGLRNVLRIVLKDIKWISLGEDKPAV
jgi:hypothetical protein